MLNLKTFLGSESDNQPKSEDKSTEREYLGQILGFQDLSYKNETMIIKAYSCELDVGGLLKKKFMECKLYFTIDGNLLIILESPTQVYFTSI